MKVPWRRWKDKKHNVEFEHSPDGGINNSEALKMVSGKNGGGCWMKYCPITPGKTYTFTVMAKKSVKAGNVSLSIQARYGNRFLGAPAVGKSVKADGSWQEIKFVFTVPNTGKWSKSNNVLVTLGAGNTSNCVTVFDDFKVEEK